MRIATVWNAAARCACMLLAAAAAWTAEISVARNGVDIPDSITAVPGSTSDNVTGTTAGSAADLAYDITNTLGSVDNLTVGAVSLPAVDMVNCSAVVVGTWPVGQITPGATATGTIRVIPTASGAWSFTLSFATNDGNENPFNFKVGGTASAPVPKIDVRDQTLALVADGGSTTPVTGTAKGLATTVTCKIENVGGASLNVSGLSLGALVNCTATITSYPSAFIAAAGASAFSISVIPGVGSWAVPVQILNNDSTAPVYDVTINGVATGPDIAVTRGNVQIPQGYVDTPPITSIAGESSSVKYTINNTGTGTLNVYRYTADALPGTFEFTAASYWATEGASTTVGVERVGGIRGAVTVDWYLDNSSAIAGLDFATGQTGTLSWADGETGIKTFTVTTLDDIFPESTEAIQVSLFGPTGGASLAALNTCSVYIEDQDVTNSTTFGRVDFTVAARTVYTLEPLDLTTRTVIREFTRTGAATGAPMAYFEIRLVDGTATRGLDYDYVTNVNGALVWSADTDGDGFTDGWVYFHDNGSGDPYYSALIVDNNKAQVPVDIIGDYLPEVNESFHIQVTNQAGCTIGPASISDPSEYWSTIFITDDDPAISTTIITEEVNCAVTLASVPDRIIASGGTTVLPLKVIPTVAGAWQFRVTISNDDPDEAAYTWLVTGNAAPDVPDIAVLRNATPIPDAGTDSVSGLVAGTTTTLTYVVKNEGTADLNLTGITIGSLLNCASPSSSITAPTTLIPGNTTTVTVQIQPAAPGAWSAAFVLANDDPDESPYNFTIQGIAGNAPTPEFQWYRSGATHTAVATGGTDNRGGSFIQGVAYDVDYLIANEGSASLTLTTASDSITATTNCTATIQAGPMASTVLAGAQTTVTFRVTPSAATWSFSYSVPTNDADENPADITVSGTASSPAPDAAIYNGGSLIANGGADAPSGLTAAQVSNLTYGISNVGSASLTLAQNYAITACLTDTDSDPLSGTTPLTSEAQDAVVGDVPTTGTSNACLYVGVDPATPFGGVVVTASTPGVGGALTWEYYTGSGWSALTMTALSGTVSLTSASNTLAWAVPSNWTALTLAGTNARWVRARVSTAFSTAPTLTRIQVGVIGNLSNCTASLIAAPAATVAAGASTSTTIAITPTVPGVFTCDVAFASNDPDENPVYWTIAASATQATPNAPEIQVERNAIAISDGSYDNLSSVTAGQPTSVTYVLRNLGAQPLVLGTPAVSSTVNCAVRILYLPDQVVGAISATQVIYEVTPSAAGAWQFQWSIATNDSDENPTDIAVIGSATAPAQAELAVSRSGMTVADGTTDSVSSTLTGIATLLDYTVSNSGVLGLNTNAAVVSGETNCTVSIETNLPPLIASGGSASLRVWVTPASAALWSFNLAFTNSDSDENPWDVVVTGTATTPTRYPEIEVRAGTTVIVNHGTDTRTTHVASGVAIPFTYTVYNLGDGPLQLVDPGLSASDVFEATSTVNCNATIGTVLTDPTVIAAGSSLPIVVSVTPILPGGQSVAVWSVVLNLKSADNLGTATDNEADQDEAITDWTLTGTVEGPEVAVARNLVDIIDGGSDATTGLAGGSPNVINYTISNTGVSDLTIGAPTVTGVSQCSAVASVPALTTIPAGQVTTFSLTITPVVAQNWTVQMSMVTNDADENPFNWTVTGYYGPDISVARGSAIATGGTDTVTGTAVGVAKSLTYVISNSGQSTLTGIGATMSAASNCTAIIVGAVPTSVAIGSSANLGVSITPLAAAAASGWTADLTIVSNDPDESSYVVHLTSGIGTPPPEVELYRGATLISDGGTDNVATAAVATKPTVLTYTIRNVGLGDLSVPSATTTSVLNCSVSVKTAPAATVVSGGSTTCQVEVIPTGSGTWTFALQIGTNDTDENPTNITVTGAANPFSPGAGDLGLGGGGGGCGAGSATGLILMGLALVSLRRRRR